MAVLNKIRQRSFFLIVIIALALFSFVLADLFRSGGFSGEKAQKTIGEVNGEEIKTSEFQNLVDSQKGRGSELQAVRNVWSQKVNSILVDQQVEETGIRVGIAHINAELERNLGNNPTFQNDKGFFDFGKMQAFVANLKETDPGRYRNWLALEESTASQAAQNVYFDMVKAGVGATVKEGELAYRLENDKINIEYVQLPYSSIKDETITVSKSDINNYVSNHKDEYSSEAFASIEYVKIDEVATLEDEQAITKQVADLLNDKEEFNNVTKATETIKGLKNTSNVEEFVNENSVLKYDDTFVFKSKLPKQVAATLFDAEVGDAFGPYKDAGYIKLSKLVATVKMPDSVKASHILIGWKDLGRGAERTKEVAKTLADSIKDVVLNNNDKFAELAGSFSEDTSNKAKGGDLGYFTPGRMVPEFNNYVFENETGDIDVVETQFGYHIIKIEDQKNIQKAVKLATVALKIEPSEKTINDIYSKSTQFVVDAREKGFEEAAKEMNLTVKPVSKMNELDENIPGLGKQRSIVRWAFEEDLEKGTVKSFDMPNGYVIATLVNRGEKGLMSSEEASAKVLPILRNQKKAEQLRAKIAGTDLEAIAKSNGVTVRSASAITMKNSTISGAGIERKVVGTAFGLEPNVVSGPIDGNKGVYVVKVTSKTPGQGLASYQGLANQQSSNQARKAQTAVLNALKADAEIKDRRAVLY